MILLGICDEDSMEDVDWLVKKIANLRVFGDENDVMNRSILDVNGEALVVSPTDRHTGIGRLDDGVVRTEFVEVLRTDLHDRTAVIHLIIRPRLAVDGDGHVRQVADVDVAYTR